jgi:hypothetical protein
MPGVKIINNTAMPISIRQTGGHVYITIGAPTPDAPRPVPCAARWHEIVRAMIDFVNANFGSNG